MLFRSDKKLAGTLDLSGFDALQKVDVSRNRLTGFTADGDGALTELNVSRNRLTEFSIENCPQISKLLANNNRLTDIDMTNLPVLKTLNLANNYLVSLDLSNSARYTCRKRENGIMTEKEIGELYTRWVFQYESSIDLVLAK